MVSLKQPCNQIQQISRVPTTPNTMKKCIGAVARRRDGDTSVVWIVDIGFCNLKIYNNKVASDKTEHKQYCNAWKQGLWFILSLVQSVNGANIIESYNNASTCGKESLQRSYLAEDKK